MNLDQSMKREVERAADAAPLDFAIIKACEAVSHNLNGQKLGAKGRLTRERIIRAAIETLTSDDDEALTLSAVARRASLGMSALYIYFNDLSELMLAVLEPVMAVADTTVFDTIREHWPDELLEKRSRAFLTAYRNFWHTHARLLHQRNRLSDAGDDPMLVHRIAAAQPLVDLLCFQLGLGDLEEAGRETDAMARVLVICIERTMTAETGPLYKKFAQSVDAQRSFDLAEASARLIEISIRDSRAALNNQRR